MEKEYLQIFYMSCCLFLNVDDVGFKNIFHLPTLVVFLS